MRHSHAQRPQDEVPLHDPKGRGKFWGVAFGAFLAAAMTTFVYFTRFVEKAPVPAGAPNGEAQVAARPRKSYVRQDNPWTGRGRGARGVRKGRATRRARRTHQGVYAKVRDAPHQSKRRRKPAPYWKGAVH